MKCEIPKTELLIPSVFSYILESSAGMEFCRGLVRLPRRLRRYIFFSIDILIFAVSIYISLGLSFEDWYPIDRLSVYSAIITLSIPVKFFTFYTMGMYHTLLRCTGLEVLGLALKSVLLSEVILISLGFLLRVPFLPRSVQIIAAIITWVLVIGLRILMYRIVTNTMVPARRHAAIAGGQRDKLRRIIIYGAGSAGFQLYQALLREHTYDVVAFVDDDFYLQGRFISRVKVYPPSELASLIAQHRVAMVLLALPSAKPEDKRRILNLLRKFPVQVNTVPTVKEILSGRVPIGKVRQVDIADLLGRAEVLPDPKLLQTNITGKTVLVTGAGGSIGSELCRQIAQQKPKLLVLYELNEFALYSIDLELAETFPHISRLACLGSVTDAERLGEIFTQYQVETVYHAAAYKHVPLVESNAAPGVINNVCGTLVAARTANDCGVDTFVLISTDKAVRPTNVMGSTKRTAELVLQALAARPNVRTRFAMVRFGNVLDSNGSVVPRFRKLIAEGKPIPVTHREITRYFMSIPEASRLVIQAGAMGQGGEVFLLEMGEPVKIYDLAVQMIELSGLIPGEDIEIEITGLRPGEKLYEELLIGDHNVMATRHPKIYAARETMTPWEDLEPMLDQLFLSAYQNDTAAIRAILQKLVPEYKPQLPATVPSLSRRQQDSLKF
jgi:FlaA1/EpsC-like NDP-sugar epimerase